MNRHSLAQCKKTTSYAKHWAGKVVAEMIRMGADSDIMRKNEIPKSVFYGVLGGVLWEKKSVPECASEMLTIYRKDFLYI